MSVGRPPAKRKTFVVKTLVEVAEFFGVTKAAVTAWKSEPNPMPRSRAGYDLSKVAQWLRQRSSGGNLSDQKKEAEVRKLTIEALQKELDYEKEKSSLVAIEDVELWVGQAFVECRETLTHIPSTIANSCPPAIRELAREESERAVITALKALRHRIDRNVNSEKGEVNDDG